MGFVFVALTLIKDCALGHDSHLWSRSGLRFWKFPLGSLNQFKEVMSPHPNGARLKPSVSSRGPLEEEDCVTELPYY